MRTVEEVAAQMSGATIFSVLDAKSSFWKVRLDHASSLRTTFTNPFCQLKFLKMPFGICTASEVFQRAMEQIFAAHPCAIIVDDIIISGKDPDEHERNLKKGTGSCQTGETETESQQMQVWTQRGELCWAHIQR